jgi:hypothetical protein
MPSTDVQQVRPSAILLGFTLVVATEGRVWAQTLEYEVKAEFIERFTRFIDWPAGAFPDAKSPFVLCVTGKNPFGKYLDALIGGRQLKNRKVVMRSVVEPSGIDGCHLLFVTNSERNRLKAIVERASTRPILTVGDTDGFARAGVLVNFYLDNETRIRFEVNADAMKLSGLKFSSKLLKLARIVAADKPQ